MSLAFTGFGSSARRSEMRKTATVGAILAFWASAAFGAEIFGTISEGEKPLPAGAAVKLDCGAAPISGVTDQYGSYSLKGAPAGDCTLSVTYKGGTGSLKVTLYEKPSRYDLVVKQEAGKLEIARK
jgi:hypothetical protein